MGGIQETLRARTKYELEQMAREWIGDRREGGLEDMVVSLRLGKSEKVSGAGGQAGKERGSSF